MFTRLQPFWSDGCSQVCRDLITDGLDRDGGGLPVEMDRLHRSSRRLIWLNPLLRYDEFQPKSQGIRAILPHVDRISPSS